MKANPSPSVDVHSLPHGMKPPPPSTTPSTSAPAMGAPCASVTRTRTSTIVPRVAVRPWPSTTVMVGVGTTCVAENTTVAPCQAACTCAGPSVLPSVHAAATRPCASVRGAPGKTEPPPESTVHVTMALGTGSPDGVRSSTTSESASVVPTVADWPSPACGASTSPRVPPASRASVGVRTPDSPLHAASAKIIAKGVRRRESLGSARMRGPPLRCPQAGFRADERDGHPRSAGRRPGPRFQSTQSGGKHQLLRWMPTAPHQRSSGSSSSRIRKNIMGTEEQRNRGTGEQGNREKTVVLCSLCSSVPPIFFSIRISGSVRGVRSAAATGRRAPSGTRCGTSRACASP